MDRLLGDPIVFAALVWTKEPLCPNLLLPSTPPFTQLPGGRHFSLLRWRFVLILATKPAVAFTFWLQNGWFAGSLLFFLLFQKLMKPILFQAPIQLNQ